MYAKLNIFRLEAALRKSSDVWEVGGVASNFYKDLDGDAIHPNAVEAAIPGFMANRGPDGLQGGPIRLHHNFWERFLKNAISALQLPSDQQMDLVAAISLPLGRVTKIWVDKKSGTTHWKGVLSQANPIARTVWNLLKEGLVHLGVSVGGKILATERGRDCIGQPCTLITQIRLDELSITDNPALRLVAGETPDNGAYITALTKSLEQAIAPPARQPKRVPMAQSTDVDSWLRKTLFNESGPSLGTPTKEAGSGKWGGTSTGLGRGIGAAGSQRPRGSKPVQMDHSQKPTGLGKKQPKVSRPAGSVANEPKTDIWGMTVGQITKHLAKCGQMSKSEWGSPATATMLTDSAHALAQSTDSPPPELINLVRFLQHLNQFAQQLPHMSDWEANAIAADMGPSLLKSLEDFKEAMPKEAMGVPVRPPGSPRPVTQHITFPNQYVLY